MSGNEIVLHHYPNSPFSEKVRLVLGMKALRWRSVIVPIVMPKPDVVALTGGYRRTPFMQIGADVYCDSALMCRVIDRLHPTPPLYPDESAGAAEIVAQWADSALFWAAIPFSLQPAGLGHIMAGVSPEALKTFAADRAAMTTSLRRAPAADAGAALRNYLDRLESMLADGRGCLVGNAVSIADFAAAQSIWFIRRAPPIATILDSRPRLVAWYERMAAFGHGSAEAMHSTDAIALAAREGAGSRHVAAVVAGASGFAAGDEVSVAAADYAHDEVAGRLVGLDDQEIVVARDDARAGRVHVHFPRLGFHLRAAAKERS